MVANIKQQYKMFNTVNWGIPGACILNVFFPVNWLPISNLKGI